eukprot:11988474-Ditylum_brightwellii.AAC.1
MSLLSASALQSCRRHNTVNKRVASYLSGNSQCWLSTSAPPSPASQEVTFLIQSRRDYYASSHKARIFSHLHYLPLQR